MKHSEPYPRSKVTDVTTKGKWTATAMLPIEQSKMASKFSFDYVLRNRRSQRSKRPAELQNLLGLIKSVLAPTAFRQDDKWGRSTKATVSAGALHPIDVLVIDGEGVVAPLLFDESTSRFLEIAINNEGAFLSALTDAKAVLPDNAGHLLLFVGDLRRVSFAYSNPERLLWRDGGAAAQAFSMAAFAYGFSYCPLGLNGDAVLEAIGPPNSSFVAIGVSLVGYG